MTVPPPHPRAARAMLAREPVHKLDAGELHRELVEDAVAGYPTPLDRFVRACDRIALQRRQTAEEAYQAVRDEVAQLTGRPGMPML